MASRQREISVSEFFLKNRHLLGFDSPSRALVTTVKEAVDNALDACEEAGILPEIRVEAVRRQDRFRVAVEDNGPGIVENQIARIFGKLLYGSKFHKLSQSRGQQGMGISAAGMYSQLTTGKPMHILSRIEGEPTASELLVTIDTTHNRPDIHRKRRIPWDKPHGTRVEVEIEGHDQKGPHSIEAYLTRTAIANPHVTIIYRAPSGEETRHERSVAELPPRPREIKPHPHGVELGRLIQMLNQTEARSLAQFLEREFSRVGTKTARTIIARAGRGLTAKSYPKRVAHAQATALHRAMETVPISAPLTDCIVPIGEERLLEGLRKELVADFFTATTRPAAVYRGNPFQVEVAIAYGRPGRVGLEVDAAGHIRKVDGGASAGDGAPESHGDRPAHLLRFANRVPLLFQQSACAITRAATQVNWRGYGLHQPKGGLPVAPMAIVVHFASVWVPYTSESKEAIAAYHEIVKEIRLALQECGRALAAHLRHNARLTREYDRRSHIEKYLPHVGVALQEILALGDDERDRVVDMLDETLHRSRRT
jgi:DNA topoisomerase VI subunit B